MSHAKGETKVIIEDVNEDDDSDCDAENGLSYDDLVAMLLKSDDKLRIERSKLKDSELKNDSLQSSLEELKTTHANLKDSHDTLNTSWGILKEKHEKLEEAHNSLLAQVKGKMSMGVECDSVKDNSCMSCSTNPSCSTSTSSCISDGNPCDTSLLLKMNL